MHSSRSSLALVSLLSLITPALSALTRENAVVERQLEKGFEAIPDWLKGEVFSTQEVDIAAEPLGKRQQPGADCYPDAWLSILQSAPVATPFCSDFIGIPAATQYDTATAYRSGLLIKKFFHLNTDFRLPVPLVLCRLSHFPRLLLSQHPSSRL